MASSSLTIVLTFVALLFVASITAQTTTTSSTTGTSTGTTTSNTTSTSTSTGSSSTSGSTSTTGLPPPANAVYGSVNVTFFTNVTTVITIPLSIPNIGRALSPPKNLVITIVNGSIGATQATVRVVAFDATKYNGNPYAAQPSNFPNTVNIPPGIFAQAITSTGTVVESFNKPIEVTLSPVVNAAGWTLAFYQPNTTTNARPAGNWIRDATTTCTVGGATNFSASVLTYKVCKLGQFQLVAPSSALTSTTGPLNAASPLSVSYITLVAMFAFSLLILA